MKTIQIIRELCSADVRAIQAKAHRKEIIQRAKDMLSYHEENMENCPALVGSTEREMADVIAGLVNELEAL
jgi:hypothetical protein